MTVLAVPTYCPLCSQPVTWSISRDRYECPFKNADNTPHFVCVTKKVCGKNNKKKEVVVYRFLIGSYHVLMGERDQICIYHRTKDLVFKNAVKTGFDPKLLDSEEKIENFIQDFQILI